MSLLPTTLAQTGSAGNAGQSVQNTAGATQNSTSPVAGGNNVTQNSTQQNDFAQLVNQQTLLTVTPELSALVNGLNIGDEISLDALQGLGIPLQSIINTQLQTNNTNSQNPLLAQTQTTGQQNGLTQNNQQQVSGLPVVTRDDINQQSVNDLAARIPANQLQENLGSDKSGLQNAIAQNPNQQGQVVQNNKNNNGADSKTNKLAAIAEKISQNTETAQQKIQTNGANNQSNSNGLLNQSLFTSDNDAVISQLTNTAINQTSGIEANQTGATAAQITQNGETVAKAEFAANKPIQTAGTPVEQISFKVAQNMQTGANKLEIQLDPAHLGKVSIQIDIAVDGKASVVVLADKNETLEMLKQDSRALQDALKNAGLQTDAGSLEFGLKDHSQQQLAHESNKAYGSANKIGSIEGIDEDLLRMGGANMTYQSNQALNIFA